MEFTLCLDYTFHESYTSKSMALYTAILCIECFSTFSDEKMLSVHYPEMIEKAHGIRNVNMWEKSGKGNTGIHELLKQNCSCFLIQTSKKSVWNPPRDYAATVEGGWVRGGCTVPTVWWGAGGTGMGPEASRFLLLPLLAAFCEYILYFLFYFHIVKGPVYSKVCGAQ